MQLIVGDLMLDTTVSGPADGPVVLLLHGFPQTAHSWRRIVPGLAEAGYRVVAPDQRGYSPGGRPDGVGAYRLPALVDDALGVLDAIGATAAHVVGHDWGAAVAWQLAARHPDRVRSLTAVSVPHPLAFIDALRTDPVQREKSSYMRDFARAGYDVELLADDAARLRSFFTGAEDSVDVEHCVRLAREPGALASWLAWYAAQRLADVEDTPRVGVPTLYVWSTDDMALGETGARGTATYVDGPYRFEVLEGVSHWVPEQAAPALLALLLEHVGRPPEQPQVSAPGQTPP